MSTSMNRPSFYSLDAYPDLASIIEQYALIQKELQANRTWVAWGSDDYDPSGHCNFLTGEWTVCPAYFGNYRPDMVEIPGMKSEQAQSFLKELPSRFPKTTAILRPLKRVNFAAFSRLHPRSTLQPHTHFNPSCLILHVGLVIPGESACGLQVGEEKHIWRCAGDSVIFDDNLEHSAWNDSDEERVILYVDFTR